MLSVIFVLAVSAFIISNKEKNSYEDLLVLNQEVMAEGLDIEWSSNGDLDNDGIGDANSRYSVSADCYRSIVDCKAICLRCGKEYKARFVGGPASNISQDTVCAHAQCFINNEQQYEKRNFMSLIYHICFVRM